MLDLLLRDAIASPTLIARLDVIGGLGNDFDKNPAPGESFVMFRSMITLVCLNKPAREDSGAVKSMVQ